MTSMKPNRLCYQTILLAFGFLFMMILISCSKPQQTPDTKILRVDTMIYEVGDTMKNINPNVPVRIDEKTGKKIVTKRTVFVVTAYE